MSSASRISNTQMNVHFDNILSNNKMNKANFLQSDSFRGKRDGYVFKNGDMGVGYYIDTYKSNAFKVEDANDNMNEIEHVAKKAKIEEKNSTELEKADIDNIVNQAESVELLDKEQLKRLIHVIEKKRTKNQNLRMKYSNMPEKFIDSELELHQAINDLFVLAASPELYSTFVEMNGFKLIFSLFEHENSDISIACVGFINELLDPDVILSDENIVAVDPSEENLDDADELETEKNIAICVVDEFLKLDGLQCIVNNLSRLDENIEEDASAVHNTLSIIENLIEIYPNSIPIKLCENTHIFQFLLFRLQQDVFNNNRLYCSEILSILLHNVESNNTRRFCELNTRNSTMNGFETLLQIIYTFRKVCIDNDDQQECIQNVFLCCSSLLMIPQHQLEFIDYEGIQLLIKCMNENKYAASCAMKTMKFALSNCYEGCLKFIQLSGLKFIFPVFMGHNIWKAPKTDKADKSMKKRIHDEKQPCEEAVISMISHLVIQTCTPQESNGNSNLSDMQIVCRNRLLNKFLENNGEKMERCAELFSKYYELIKKTDEDLRALRYQLLQLEDEIGLEELDDVEMLYSKRLTGGLLQLQELSIILLFVCVSTANASSNNNENVNAPSKVSKDIALNSLDVIQSKLAIDNLSMVHVLDTVREAIAHIADPKVLTVEEEDETDEDEDEEIPYILEIKKDRHLLMQIQSQKRDLLLHWSSMLSKSVGK